jgi:7-carboxy-7-deazaguanine synthase
MHIAEVFYSIQGEGRLAGTPSTFIRTSGCNLRCVWCDTPYTSWEPEGEERSIDSLLDQVQSHDCRHVVITGGEPMLVSDVVELTERLHERGHHLTIETAGTVDLPVTADLMSISPKLSNSTPAGTDWESRHDQRRRRPDIVLRLTADYDYQLKFVIDSPGDLDEVETYLSGLTNVDPDKVLLMPQGIEAETIREKSAWIGRAARDRGWGTSPRLHVELFGNMRGT